jgi:uncharacterized phage protein gp47/JayE
MAGITDEGLEIKRLPDIRDSIRRNATDIFSDLVPAGDVLDTSEASTIGRLVNIAALSETDLWEAIQEVYLAFDPNSASGIALDNLVALSGIVRRGATASTARVLLRATSGIIVPQNSVVSSSLTNTQFNIIEDVIFDSTNVVGVSIGLQTVAEGSVYEITYQDSNNTVAFSYTAQAGDVSLDILNALTNQINTNLGTLLTANVSGDFIEIEADNQVSQASYSVTGTLYFNKTVKGTTVEAAEVGPKQQSKGTIDVIATPVSGWDSVEQITSTVVGSLGETDAELRARFNETKYTRGSNIMEALRSQLLNVDGVTDVRVYENETNSTDANGLPPHSFRVLIRGGLEEEIAYTIWRNKPAGIATSGNVVVEILDQQGNLKPVYLQRPEFIDIYVSVAVTTDRDFPTNGVEQIRGAIFEYIRDNAGVGEPVNYSRLYTPVNSVPGHFVDSLFVDTTASPTGTSNISINFDQIAKLELGNIEVTAT